MRPLELFDAFIAPLEQAGLKYFATGSVASIIYGEPRLTHDIDIVIHLRNEDVEALISLFPEDRYYCPTDDVIHIERKRRPYAHFNVIHHESGLKADFYPDTGNSLHLWAFQHKRRIELSTIKLWVAPPEYVIIRKLEYHREGGSEKHVTDIQKMIAVSGETLDLHFLEMELTQRGLMPFWKLCQSS